MWAIKSASYIQLTSGSQTKTSGSLSTPYTPRATRACLPRRPRSRLYITNQASESDERATLPKDYTFHTPGSVQEPTKAPSAPVFAHQTPEEAEKWSNTSITHIGDVVSTSSPKQIGVVLGEFHNTLMDQCLEDARLAAKSMNAEVVDVVWVPGSYEAPLVCKTMLEAGKVDAVVVLGYIEKGDTLHGQEMGATCSLLLKQLELEYGKPVGMGIIGPGATAEQAAKRVAYAGNATRAAIRLCHYMDSVKA